jgi:hypothetical protein
LHDNIKFKLHIKCYNYTFSNRCLGLSFK